MSTSRTGAKLFVEALERYGVEHFFGNPGTTELPVVQAVGESSLEYVLGLHEDVAVGMAAGYASTRRYHSHHDPSVNPIGVANVHVAPGLAHGLGNIIGAAFAGSPVLVTAGNHSTDFQHQEPILHGELEGMVEPYTKWAAEVKHVDALATMVRRAVRVALTPPTGPVFLALPLDVMIAETDTQVDRLGSIPNAGSGDPVAIENAAKLLAAAHEPVIVVGDEVARAGMEAVDAVVELAEASGARVHNEFLATEVSFPTAHAQWASQIAGSEAGFADTLDTDTVVFVGCSTMTTPIRHEDPLVPADASTVHIGPDAWELGKTEHSDVSVLGDCGLVAAEVADRTAKLVSDDERRERLNRGEPTIEWFSDRGGSSESRGDDPRASKDQLAGALAAAGEGAYLVNEGVTSSAAVRRRVTFQPEGKIGNKSGGLGYGLPAALGAAVAERERPSPRDVIAFIGDGSYYYYPNSIYSAVRHDLDLTVIVANNRNYRILKDNTIRVLGGTEDDYEFVGMDFEPPLDVSANAKSYGATARRIDDPDAIEAAIETARNEEGTTVLDVQIHD